MTSIPFFQIDAFADRPLTGNPAAVMPLERWLDDATMQAIASENNLSETAFTVPSEGEDADYDLRWFTPTSEVELCGHATLAAGHVLIHSAPVRFATRHAGVLTVARRDDLLELDLPAAELKEVHEPELTRALGLPDFARLARRRMQRRRHHRGRRRGGDPVAGPRPRRAFQNPPNGRGHRARSGP